MIKNLEVSIYKRHEIYEPENFNSEFASISYYFFLKMKEVLIEKCSYIKILITNEKEKNKWNFKILDKILFIDGTIDFSPYLILEKEQKLKFQYEMMHSILKEAFIHYKVDWKILDGINNVLADSNWQMKYEFLKKKIEKGKEFRLVIYMDIDAFTFTGVIIENGKKKEVQIFKSIPSYFAVDYLFKGYQFIENKVRIGSKEKAVFELDLNTESVEVVDKDNAMLNKLRLNKKEKS